MRIAHLSDLHVLDLAGARARDFLNKRLTGSATLLLRRSTAHQTSVVEAAIRDIQEQEVDHVVVTGDLTNLSLPSEFAAATGLLRRLGDRTRVSVVPGNHDVYTRSSKGLFEQACAEWLPEEHAERGFPWVKHLTRAADGADAGVSLIGLTTAFPTPWFFAHGRVGKPQLDRLAALLASPELRGRFVAVMLHHPLVDDPPHRLFFMRSLRDAGALAKVLKEGDAKAILHGHNHIQHSVDVAGIPTHTAASTSNIGPGTPKSRAWAKYRIWEIDAAAPVARELQTRRYDPDAASFIAA